MTLAQPIEMSTFLYERLRIGHATPGCKQNLTASPNFPGAQVQEATADTNDLSMHSCHRAGIITMGKVVMCCTC